ncbi:hypothetical protein EYC80_008138 [Monilinia laxa]|uniref:Uncharacterized protein n=1 Tax=Monilinia laxa TaxID=61186 RepID=A0A5N6JUV8_MONLA|nr:hypothetical protein EYC80_008138 [Monilinia laxa]
MGPLTLAASHNLVSDSVFGYQTNPPTQQVETIGSWQLEGLNKHSWTLSKDLRKLIQKTFLSFPFLFVILTHSFQLYQVPDQTSLLHQLVISCGVIDKLQPFKVNEYKVNEYNDKLLTIHLEHLQIAVPLQSFLETAKLLQDYQYLNNRIYLLYFKVLSSSDHRSLSYHTNPRKNASDPRNRSHLHCCSHRPHRSRCID